MAFIGSRAAGAEKSIFPAVYKGRSLQPHAPLLYEAKRRDVANI
jgi:hypothetical protein